MEKNEITAFFENDDYLNEIIHDDTVAMNNTAEFAMYQILGTRKNQQDSMDVCQKEDSILAVVCDGMGGLQGGEIASSMTVKTIVEDYMADESEDITSFLLNEVIKIDRIVSKLMDNEGSRLNAGTTLAAVIIREQKLYYVSVGDSRIYLLRGSEMALLTEDQNYGMTLKKSLREGKIDEEKYRQEEKYADALISYIGMDGLKVIGCNSDSPLTLLPGDKILLCSDGLYKSVPEEKIKGELINCNTENVKVCLEEMIDSSYEYTKKQNRKQDNTTAVLLVVS